MKTIYLDHNIVHYFVKGFPKRADAAKEHRVLTDAIASHPDIRFTISDWNILEAARECASSASRKPEQDVELYAGFFESLYPLFVPTHDIVEKDELKAIACAHWKMPRERRSPNWPFAENYTEIATTRIGVDTLVGFTPRIYLRHLVNTPPSIALFRDPVARSMAAVKTAMQAHAKGMLGNAALTQATFRDWFFSLLPERDGKGKWIPVDLRRELASDWSSTPDDILDKCPAMAIESAMTDLRATATDRDPRPSDAYDLMHAIPALAYCDAIITNDKRLGTQAHRACARRNVVVSSKLSDAVKAVLRIVTRQQKARTPRRG